MQQTMFDDMRSLVHLAKASADATSRSRTVPNSGPRDRRKHRRLTDADYTALANFRRAIREFLAFSAEGAADRGLTSQQHQALLAIRAHAGPEPISIGELADELAIKNHSAIGLVARLADGGYARRSPSLVDRRRVLVTLTQAGETVLEEISQRNLAQLGEAADIIERLFETTRTMGEGDAATDMKKGAAPSETAPPVSSES